MKKSKSSSCKESDIFLDEECIYIAEKLRVGIKGSLVFSQSLKRNLVLGYVGWSLLALGIFMTVVSASQVLASKPFRKTVFFQLVRNSAEFRESIRNEFIESLKESNTYRLERGSTSESRSKSKLSRMKNILTSLNFYKSVFFVDSKTDYK